MGYHGSDPWEDGTVGCQNLPGMGVAMMLSGSPFIIMQNTPWEVANKPENFVFN
jgi:hypothetical protein